jgi:hypothetical protein
MGAHELIAELRAGGLYLSLNDEGGIQARPKSALTDVLRALIRANRPAIVAALSEPQPTPTAIDPEAFDERAAIREYDAGFGRSDAELLAAWDLTQALFQRLTAREHLARYAPSRLPAGDSAKSYPAAHIPPGNDSWLERQRRGGER